MPSLPVHMALRPRAVRSAEGVNIDAWTSDAIEALSTANISAAAASGSVVRGTSVVLDIPLDAELPASSLGRTVAIVDGDAEANDHAGRRIGTSLRYSQQRPLLRRDSLKRREALLKGREGSRRRQKWENDRLIGNPWVEPPEPNDWEPRPTYPVHNVPYFLAPRWDEGRVQNEIERAAKARDVSLQEKQDAEGNIPKDLRHRLKHSKAAKGLLQDLEERIREFILIWEDKEKQLKEDGWVESEASSTYSSEEDDEIVFVGRNGEAKDKDEKLASTRKQKRDKLIFDSLLDDHGASFGRWLVHSIAAYYNLQTWSVTRGNPARREAYVGLKDGVNGPGCGPELSNGLPYPLWAIV